MADVKKNTTKTSPSKTPKAEKEVKTATEFPEYKGKPLVRCNDTLYYGNMTDPYVIKMIIRSKKQENGMELADKVSVQLLSTEPMVNPKRQIIKTSEKSTLYAALDIADAWLERYLRDAKKANTSQ